MISWDVRASGKDTEEFLKGMLKTDIPRFLAQYGEQGVSALRAHTPVDSGLTAESWGFEIVKDTNGWGIIWTNTHVEDGRPVAILIQYDHMTGTGGFVRGRDYINPAMQPIFDRISEDLRRVVITG